MNNPKQPSEKEELREESMEKIAGGAGAPAPAPAPEVEKAPGAPFNPLDPRRSN